MARKLRIEFHRRAAKALDLLHKSNPSIAEHVAVKIQQLLDNPYPISAVIVQGEKGALRIRVATMRIVYSVDEQKGLVFIKRIEKREKAYSKHHRK